MGEQREQAPMRRICAGLLAHVDAGKTTLSEGMLYVSGSLRKLGRVDHKDAFLDTFALERERGITIFSKQAVFSRGDLEVTLLDTPGHVDFSAETERTLGVLDCAILVISGVDGVQGHTETLWRLLRRHGVPVFLFLNKMDLPGVGRAALMEQLRRRLDEGCVDFTPDQDRDAMLENIAMYDEGAMETYLETGTLDRETIGALVARRAVFPCYFGAALRLDGVEALLDGLADYLPAPVYPPEFGARVFKIARDPQGGRLTYLKVTGGTLKVKDLLSGGDEEEEWREKVDQLRIYSGAKFRAVEEAPAGTVCAVTGLSQTKPGQGLGWEEDERPPVLTPVLTYQLCLPAGCDPHSTLRRLKELEEEDPQLHLVWNERLQELHVQLMGEVQLEVLQALIKERFDLDVTFGTGSILYQETIAGPVRGIGHYEPLRHYAEVHLLLEPGERGSGVVCATACSEDMLDGHWQRLILTHLAEKAHAGVLTGAPLTDVRITLLAGRAHLKHTEGGDFRQATYRAVRQGLMSAQSILLEPWYDFRLEVPAEQVGRAMTDLQRMGGEVDPPETLGEGIRLTGGAPVAGLRDYASQVASYTRGRGRLTCTLRGYAPCQNQEDIVAASGYDPCRDTENPPDSVFCAHGAGYVVPWDQVPDHAHVNSGFYPEEEEEPEDRPAPARRSSTPAAGLEADKELMAIFERTYGPVKRQTFRPAPKPVPREAEEKRTVVIQEQGPEYLLVDGYNIIFAWDELHAVARSNLDAARQMLIDLMSNYQGFRKCRLILVFDAYRVPGNPGQVVKYHNIHVVYTKEAETADTYIERATYALSRDNRVRVATSDGVEQLIILGHGALRVSARTFHDEVTQAMGQISDLVRRNNQKNKGSKVGEVARKAQRKGGYPS